eukprot:scaffold7125_cov118-Isochrysis_galbana.AAC.10
MRTLRKETGARSESPHGACAPPGVLLAPSNVGPFSRRANIRTRNPSLANRGLVVIVGLQGPAHEQVAQLSWIGSLACRSRAGMALSRRPCVRRKSTAAVAEGA